VGEGVKNDTAIPLLTELLEAGNCLFRLWPKGTVTHQQVTVPITIRTGYTTRLGDQLEYNTTTFIIIIPVIEVVKGK
jgi:hypothetical protein